MPRIFLIFISNPPPPPVPGSDYTGVTEFLIFSSPSNTRQCVNIAIATDDFVENTETFTVELSGNTDGALGVSMATVTILDLNSKFPTSL